MREASATDNDRKGALSAAKAPRIAIESVEPSLNHGRFASKAIVGDPIPVTAVIFADGHDLLSAVVRWRKEGGDWHTQPMARVTPLGNDLWEAEIRPEDMGRHHFMIEAWWDVFGTYRDELYKKHHAGVTVGLELEEGRLLIAEALGRTRGQIRKALNALHTQLEDSSTDSGKVALMLDPDTHELMEKADPRRHRVRSATLYPFYVDRVKARFASWYELFPRSETDDPNRHGTFRDVQKRLPMIRDMGFDVLYFTPIHPIGRTHRKGKNNTLEAGPDDVGSPYAIGNEEGGHEAIHPKLGTFADFQELERVAAAHGLEIALDFAIQCSPDHPWLKKHPGWFSWRPDGSIRYAENPPKKYQDIVNVDFYAEDAIPDLWLAWRDVVQGWIDQGVRIFRVDNPHTKPFPFWEWLIDDIRSRDPGIIFLSEAFTRPAVMLHLGKLGFTQSYTYFTWRNTKAELAEYLTTLSRPPWRDGYRPNFFVNTPDINPYFLQSSSRAGFLIRAALAALGAGSWGMYSGFELCENEPMPGKEEYLHSEKYEVRSRDFSAPGNIIYEIAQLNRIRRENPAFQTHLGISFHSINNDRLLYFCKRTSDNSNVIFVVISLDPFDPQEGSFELPLWEFGLPEHAALDAEDLMTGHSWTWHGKWQWTRLDPSGLPFGIWRVSLP
ncbi:alpha-1,4-glucan--maltose-1-phosphate maltosyltransferase [Marinobacter changyiensis]|uniref:alpha-1,4-glucan--maltose-1-phosphate maltosyltransferase n=1 Tax=Marinobacter changyiensis TaxID=2604091 RepID=UPI001264A3D9|nr:alpha-1,4-glucan--maltose-1-phosphate maltosyltransferase [Marinobacter changyiensis]